MFHKTVITLLVLLMLSCSPSNKPMIKDFDRENQVLLITVHVYKDRKHLIKATKKYKTDKQIGLAVWNNKDNKCDIYVIKPTGINSKQDITWGHELRHCVYGSFHKEH